MRWLSGAVLSDCPQIAEMGSVVSQPGVFRMLERTLRIEPGNWLTYSGDYRSHHYSNLNQITADNGPFLQLWQIGCQPWTIQVDPKANARDRVLLRDLNIWERQFKIPPREMPRSFLGRKAHGAHWGLLS